MQVLLLCSGAWVATSCDDDDDNNAEEAYFTLDDPTTEFSNSSSSKEFDAIVVRSNRAWRIECTSDDNDGWARAFPDEGEDDGRFRFIITKNSTFEAREAEFQAIVDGEAYPVTFKVTQAGAVPTITIGNGTDTEYNIATKGGTLTLTSSSNVDWTCNIEQDTEWLTLDGIADNGVLTFSAPENRGEARSAVVHFVCAAYPSANVDITVNQADGSVILQEDFSWLNYGSGSAHTYSGETRYDKWTDEEKAHGWTSTSVSGTPYLYARQGILKLGKTAVAGDAISPALSDLEGTADVQVTFKATGYISKAGTKDSNELYIFILGAGTIEGDDMFVIDNYPNSSKMENGEDYNEWATDIAQRSFIIRGATSETQIRFMGGVAFDLAAAGVSGSNRIFLDDITVKYVE